MSMSPLERFSRWLKLKIYQLEVTLSVYMFTPLERMIFWSIIFLLGSLTFLATIFYMPQHIMFVINRAWFYARGDTVDVLEMTKDNLHTLAQGALGTSTEGIAGAVATAAGIVREL